MSIASCARSTRQGSTCIRRAASGQVWTTATTGREGCRRCRAGSGRPSGCATVWGWRPSVTSRAACTSPPGATGSGARRSRASARATWSSSAAATRGTWATLRKSCTLTAARTRGCGHATCGRQKRHLAHAGVVCH